MKPGAFGKFGKFVLCVFFIGITYAALFAGLIWLTSLISGSGLLGSLSIVSRCQSVDISAYVIAAATLEFAALTMLQQHITRQQDRALEFPNICIDQCELITSPEAIVAEVIGTDTVNGDCIVKISFKSTFPVYYTPKIHRAWVRRIIYQESDQYNRMKVYSSFLKSRQNAVIWNIQVDAQKDILEVVRRSQTAGKESLEFIYDVSWENQLLPWLYRVLSKLYMRLTIRLEDMGVKNNTGCVFAVRGIKISKLSILAIGK